MAELGTVAVAVESDTIAEYTASGTKMRRTVIVTAKNKDRLSMTK